MPTFTYLSTALCACLCTLSLIGGQSTAIDPLPTPLLTSTKPHTDSVLNDGKLSLAYHDHQHDDQSDAGALLLTVSNRGAPRQITVTFTVLEIPAVSPLARTPAMPQAICQWEHELTITADADNRTVSIPVPHLPTAGAMVRAQLDTQTIQWQLDDAPTLEGDDIFNSITNGAERSES